MAETLDDIRVNLIETTCNLGITLSSNNTRIKHSKTGVFDISSNGSIEIVSGNRATNQYGFDAGGNIIVQPGNGNLGGSVSINGGEGVDDSGNPVGNAGGNIVIRGGLADNNGFGGNIEITAGTGKDATTNVGGGNITITGGQAKGIEENGGQISITGGQGGSSTFGGAVSITGGGSTGNKNGANLTISGGGGGSSGKQGRVICNSLFRVNVFANDAARDNINLIAPISGDICFVITGLSPSGNNKLQVYTGSAWEICN